MIEIIKFYSSSKTYGEFSNLYPATIEYNGRVWNSVEHCYQYHKLKDKQVAEWLISAPKTSAMAIAGHGFSNHEKYIRDDWDTFKFALMYKLLIIKFQQHEELMGMLVGTGDAILQEDSKHDYIWGIGENGTGNNKLGEYLMQIREFERSGRLREESRKILKS